MGDEAGKVIPLGGYDNVLVVDDQGKTLYYDLADLNILMKLGHRPEDFLGLHITSFYSNLTQENSTIFHVLRTGKALTHVEQRLITKTGHEYTSKSSTYPISEGGRVIGAIEFSTHYFGKDQMPHLEGFAGHPIYRKNGTIYTVDDIISESAVMASVKEKIRRVAKRDTTVLFTGPTGTGKKVAAQALHNLSSRFAGPFISIDCGTISGEVMEQMLFGTDPADGAAAIPGLFEQAEGGTLYLDRVNALSVTLQPRLLKVIEDRRVRRVGGTTDIPLDFRVAASLNEDPETLMETGKLREDFYYRLAVMQIDLPSLKDRKEDILAYADHFIRFYNHLMDMGIKGLDRDAAAACIRYKWPGNVRELRNAMESAFSQTDGPEIGLNELPDRLVRETGNEEESILPENGNLRDAIDGYERHLIVHEYEKSGHVLAETARRLGISKQSLKYKLDKYGLRRE